MKRPGTAASRRWCAALLVGAAAMTAGASTANFWRVSTQAESAQGASERLRSTTTGRSCSGPSGAIGSSRLPRLVWCLARSRRLVYAGGATTASSGRSLPRGPERVVFDAQEMEVHAILPPPMARARRDIGRRPSLQGRGRWNLLGVLRSEDKYIWASPRRAGRRVCRHRRQGRDLPCVRPTEERRVQDPTANVTSLRIGPDGQLLASNGIAGRVLRSVPAGKAFVLLESAVREVRGLRVTAAAPSSPPPSMESPAPPSRARRRRLRKRPARRRSPRSRPRSWPSPSSTPRRRPAAPRPLSVPSPSCRQGRGLPHRRAGGQRPHLGASATTSHTTCSSRSGSVLVATALGQDLPARRRPVARHAPDAVSTRSRSRRCWGPARCATSRRPTRARGSRRRRPRRRRPVSVGGQGRGLGRGLGFADVEGGAGGKAAPSRSRTRSGNTPVPTTRGATGPRRTNAPRATA